MSIAQVWYRGEDDGRSFVFRIPLGKQQSPMRRPPEYRGRATVKGASVVITELTLEDAAGVSADALREVPLGEIRARLHRDVIDHPKEVLESCNEVVFQPRRLTREERATRLREIEAVVAPLRERAPRPGDDFYRRVAEAYLRFLKDRPRDPVIALTDELRSSRAHAALSVNTVTSWVRRSRERGWLSPAVRGAAGAEPGPKLIAYWKGRQKEV